jgi:hypothetical protein
MTDNGSVGPLLAGLRPSSHTAPMFAATEAEAAAIRAAFEQGGEFAAAVELRRSDRTEPQLPRSFSTGAPNRSAMLGSAS